MCTVQCAPILSVQCINKLPASDVADCRGNSQKPTYKRGNLLTVVNHFKVFAKTPETFPQLFTTTEEKFSLSKWGKKGWQ